MRIVIAFSLTILLSFTGTTIVAAQSPVPEGYRLKKEADFKKYEQDVLNTIDWLDTHPIDKYPAIRSECQRFLMEWITGVPYVSVMIAKPATVAADKNTELLLTFMGGWIKYVVKEGGDTDDNVACTLAAMNNVLDYYEKGNGLDKNKELDKLLKTRASGGLEDWVRKQLK